MKMISCKCPKCGASIQLNEKLERGTCNFCGAEIINDDVVKVKVDGEVLVSNIDLEKEIETAQKLYESNEPKVAIKTLKLILKKDLFNYEVLYLYLKYNFSSCSDWYLFINNDLIKININRFETVMKNSDDIFLKECKLKLKKANIKYKIIIFLPFILSILLLLFLIFRDIIDAYYYYN